MRVSTVWVCVQEVIITVSASCACYSVQQSCVLGMCVMCDCFSFLDDLVCWYWTFSPKLRVTYLLQHPETLHDSPQPLITLYHIKCPSGPFFFPSIYIQQDNPCPSVTIYSPLCSPRIHPHRHPLSHFPKQKNTFLAVRLGLFFPSLGCLKTQSSTSKTLTIPIYPVNLTPFSLCSFFLLRNTHVLTHIRAQPQTHTYLKFISAAIQMQRSNFQYWYIYREKHRDPSRHTNTCAHKHVK